MIIQSLIKRKQGTNVLLGTNTYEFRPNAAGDHVAEVGNKEHIETLLAIEHGFKEYKAGGKKAETPAKAAEQTVVEAVKAADELLTAAAETPAAPAADEKAALLAEAKALGINANANWGVGGLKKAIAKVKGN